MQQVQRGGGRKMYERKSGIFNRKDRSPWNDELVKW
jgi:hypothetical protein